MAMSRFRLKARDMNVGVVEGGVEWGNHKFIVRTLIDLG